MTKEQMTGLLNRLDGIECELFSQFKGLESVRKYLHREWKIPMKPEPSESDSDVSWMGRALAAEAFLERAGFRRCDVPACNCNSWHPAAVPQAAQE